MKKEKTANLNNIKPETLRLMDKGQYSEALALADEIVRRNNSDFDGHTLRGDCEVGLRRFEEARVSYKKAQHLQPEIFDAEIWNSKGNLLFNDGYYREAIPYYEEAIKADGNFVWAYRNHAVALERCGEYAKSIEVLRKAISIDDQYQTSWLDLGRIYLNLEDYPQALSCYEKAETIDRMASRPVLCKGICQFKMGNKIDGIDSINKAFDLDPGNLLPKEVLAELYIAEREYDKCLQVCEKIIELAPQKAEGYRYKGYTLASMNLAEKANDAFQQCIRALDTQIAESLPDENQLLLKAEMHRRLNQFDDSEQTLKKALKLMPASRRTLMAFVGLYSDYTNNHELAKKYCEEILKINPDDKLAIIILGETLIKLDQYEAARSRFDELSDSELLPYQRCLVRLLTSISYSLEQEEHSEKFSEFLEYYKQLPDHFTVDASLWVFKGLIDSIMTSEISPMLKFDLVTMIDVVRGSIPRKDLAFFTRSSAAVH